MTEFAEYAKYYNLMYHDKDYDAEVAYLLSTLSRFGCHPKVILDIGCGTGRHGLALCSRGIKAFGVDKSEMMIGMGTKMLEEAFPSVGQAHELKPELFVSDASKFSFPEKKFDAVVSLFHVMSYVTLEDDLLEVLKSAYSHMKEGGIFFFDFWHGPGVLCDPPVVRNKVMENDDVQVIRISTPECNYSDNIVKVNFQIDIMEKSTQKISHIEENHTLRYYFFPELRHLSKLAGFSEVAGEGVWMGSDENVKAGKGDWYAWIALKK